MRPSSHGALTIVSLAVLLLECFTPSNADSTANSNEEGAFLMLRLTSKLDSQGPSGEPGIDPETGKTCAGDPSLVLNTNMKLGERKSELMRAVSRAVASGLGKPESFVAVSINDGQHIIWGGEDTPCALGTLYSLGAINLENNKKVSAEIASLLNDLGIPSNRVYVSCFDVPRENMMYKGATFGG